MNDISCRKIKTGHDPRPLADYATLRDEMSKLTHPARPDVNWGYAEKLCLSLFEQNGVELQTAAWYTLARTQLAGLYGLNEGLSILEALIGHQWAALWPQPVHARMEILSGLSQRIQQLMRTLPLNYSDLSQLYRAEQQLTRIAAILQRLELKHLSQFDMLRTLMVSGAARLENSGDASGPGAAMQADIVLPATLSHSPGSRVNDLPGISVAGKNQAINAVKWVYVAQPEHQPNIEVMTAIPTPVKPWKPFAAGACSMLVISAVTVWGWHFLNRPDPLQAQLVASLAPLPAMLTPAQRDTLRQLSPLPQALFTQTRQQLTRLEQLPADWKINYGRQLVEQAQSLWPGQATALALEWQQQLNASALPAENLDGWHQGMTTLQELGERLNGLDQQKRKYMTVSELKSVVFSAMRSFNQSTPAEEQLRSLSQNPAGQLLPAAAKAQLEMHLQQLTARYAEIKHNEALTGPQ